MSLGKGTAAFLDTSIQIARVVHDAGVKARIKERTAPYNLLVTSGIVKQEYKRRLLEEVQWCLNQLNDPKKPKTFEALFRHVTDFLPPQQERKRNICTQICHTVLSVSGRGDMTERARRHFRTLLRTGMALFELGVGYVVPDCGCACANHPITEEKPYQRYDFGPTQCTKCADRCAVGDFLTNQGELLNEIRAKLDALPTSLKLKADKKPTELGKFAEFLTAYLDRGVDPVEMNPCLTVGDLLIALESRNIPHFYTMNGKESQFFCRWLGQTLIVRRRFPAHEDIVCKAFDEAWPSFS